MRPEDDMKAGALILAAGASSRLGTPKQVARVSGETLLDRAIRTAREAGCRPVVVVLGAYEDEVRQTCRLKGAEIVSNPRWADGMGTSLAAGVQWIAASAGVVVMTCDMPGVTAEHVRALAAQGTLACSGYGGTGGVPAFFPPEFLPYLSRLDGDGGARRILAGARQVELPSGSFDIDRAEDLERARRIFG